MIVPTAALILALTLMPSSTVAHGPKRSHKRMLPFKRGEDLSPRALYDAAAHRARDAGLPVAPRKRSTCSTSSSANSTTSYLSASGTTLNAAVVAPSASSSSAAASSSSSSAARASSSAATKTSSSSAAASASASSKYDSPWKLDLSANGTSFFDTWTFWDYTDPTGGTVNYVDSATAWNDGLASFSSAGNAVMKVDTTATVSDARNSVRLHSTYTFNGGLIILDAVHMPTGCGTWPAFWANGPNWPAGGEIDIVEGVNDFTMNQASIHTSPGCTIPSDFGAQSTTSLTTGSFTNTDCGAAATNDQGCGERSSTANNYGSGFNSNGGGVYAMKWDSTGISVYFFARGSIPDDITLGTPVPSTWGLPQANFPSTSCDPYTFFTDNFAIFDTTLCGDWAGNIWNDSGYAGQSTSCAASTGYSTCSDYVLNEGGKFTEAYWEVKSVNYYQPK